MRIEKLVSEPRPGRFSASLLKWNTRENNRPMPWKGVKDPYRVWLSEIILQQTRVEQGLAYYNRFVEKFPTIEHLADAPDSVVFKLWEGLGYYSRCRNLLFTARHVRDNMKGKFPDNYNDIKSLKGVGPYTAAAIASFAYNLPHAVVDGNVFRVLSRVFGISTPIDSTQGKKIFSELAEDLMDKEKPAIYNQAIMDFGATMCKPVQPLCTQCPMKIFCTAYNNESIGQLPVKEKKIKVRKRWFYYLLMEHENKISIRQRTTSDIWNQLYEFPLIETEEALEIPLILKRAEQNNLLPSKKYSILNISPEYKQQLSHQQIFGRFIVLSVTQKTKAPDNSIWIKKAELAEYALPRLITQYLQKNK